MNDIPNIRDIIRDHLNEQKLQMGQIANETGKDVSNLNKELNKVFIHPNLLLILSKVLKKDFFSYYSQYLLTDGYIYQTAHNNMMDMHMGNIVRWHLNKQERPISWLASKTGRDSSNLSKQLNRPVIKIRDLLLFSKALKVDFFSYYSKHLSDGGYL